MSQNFGVPAPATGREIIAEAARRFDCKPLEIYGKCKARHLAYARFAIVWVLRERSTDAQTTWAHIARLLNMHRTSILNGYERATAFRKTDPIFRFETDRLLRIARGSMA